MFSNQRAGVLGAYAGMCAIWGTTWLVIKIALHYGPPMTGVGLRFVIAGLALGAVGLTQPRPRAATPWKLVAVLAFFLFGLNYVCTYAAETRLDSGLVAVLFGTLPFFMFGLGHYVAHELTTPRIWIGAVIAFAGVAIISLGSQVQGSPLFALAAIVAAASSAFANVYAKRHAHHAPLVTLPPAMIIAGVVVGVFGALTEHPDWHAILSAPSLGAIGYLALVGSGIAFFFNLWLLQRIAAWVVGLSSLIIPVLAVTVGVVFGSEHFGAREILGSLAVVAGMAVALTKQTAGEITPAECDV
ncbi:MAG TPA: EamA family transporter [Candidatus Baltobacteraceae bacterium]|nr:EamA family transporter [Candidatus Baltobacteraceae bacterium]